MSRARQKLRWIALTALCTGTAMLAHAQYAGRVTKDADTAPTLRATAVYEWTGDLAKPKSARLVPIAVWDGSQYQPGGLYLAQPQPITVLPATLYELEQAGSSKGTFQVDSSVQLLGSWVGLGYIRPAAPPKAKPPSSKYPATVVKEVDPDRPVLHKKDSAQDSTSGNNTSSNGNSKSSDSSQKAPSSDSDRPTLHKRDDSTQDSTSTSTTDSSKSDTSSNSGSQNTSPSDQDRPTLHKRKDKDVANVSTGAGVTAAGGVDPDRPKLRYGIPDKPEGMVEPAALQDLPGDMEQMAAVSDVKLREPHSFVYSWADPADAGKMKAAMEGLARQALFGGPATITAHKSVTATGTKSAAVKKPVLSKLPAILPELEDENFHAFELSYSGGATLVFSAKTPGEGDQVKYITLIAQPDFYGTPQVIFKQITSEDRLDLVPRMRLVDAVDTDADNRAELIFELRGKSGREFGIYRVVNRHVEQVFNTGQQL